MFQHLYQENSLNRLKTQFNKPKEKEQTVIKKEKKVKIEINKKACEVYYCTTTVKVFILKFISAWVFNIEMKTENGKKAINVY